jgi:hypothetical protein
MDSVSQSDELIGGKYNVSDGTGLSFLEQAKVAKKEIERNKKVSCFIKVNSIPLTSSIALGLISDF